jgi:hypothetical protein
MKRVTHPDRRMWRHLSIALALGAGVGFALPAAASVSQLPMAQHEGKVTYLSGGIGEREAKAMQEAAPKYPLEVEFIKKEPSGPAAYLANDKVAIRDRAGKTVLSTTSTGPFLLAKLPPGRYTVMATNNKASKARKIDLAAGKHEKLVFEW